MPTRTLIRRFPPVRKGSPIYQSTSTYPLRRARRRLLAAALAGSLAAGCGGGGEPPGQGAAVVERARVVRVVDGDTLVARLGGDDVRVRLLGVDAPESVTPGRPVECHGPQAGARLRALLPAGAAVELAVDPSQGREDRFGRLLAEVSRPGAATTANEAMVARGDARAFRGDGRARLLPRLLAAERRAREARRGLWAACAGR